MKYAFLLLVLGCAGPAAVAGETARATACQALESAIEKRVDDGALERDAAFEQIDCARAACDAIRLELLRAGGVE